MGYFSDLTEKVILPQGQKVVCHHQSISRLKEPHRSAIQNGGAEETLFIHVPQYWSATGIHHHPIVERDVREGRMEGEEMKGGKEGQD